MTEAKVKLSSQKTLLGRPPVPSHCLLPVPFDATPLKQAVPKIALRVSVAVVGGTPKPDCRSAGILTHTCSITESQS
jgi:hypothetical protein